MKALTLQQPWATLVAIGAKKIETRSWKTNYRGEIAIHVSKHLNPVSRSLAMTFTQEPFATALYGVFWDKKPSTLLGQPAETWQCYPERFNLGCVIATCELVHCIQVTKFQSSSRCAWIDDKKKYHEVCVPPESPEYDFGDYTPGRFAWILENVKILDTPIPAKGALGLWEWSPAPSAPSEVG